METLRELSSSLGDVPPNSPILKGEMGGWGEVKET